MPTYEREAIRPHVLGKFRDLLEATAKSPAMLFYLDNWQSVGPDAATAARKCQAASSRGLNENYARELMELHTLGVDGGYTQKDIIEVARCFTGWTIRQPRQGGDFFYNDRVHDKGEKDRAGREDSGRRRPGRRGESAGYSGAASCRRRALSRRSWRSVSWPTIRRRS